MDSMTMTTSTAMSSMAGMATTAAAAATSTITSMDMDMGSGECKVSMLWNWNTIDACFLTSSWHINTHAQFAGSCIGVILLVIMLEFLRHLAKQYDRLLRTQHQRAYMSSIATNSQHPALRSGSSSDGNHNNGDATPGSTSYANSQRNGQSQSTTESKTAAIRAHVRGTLAAPDVSPRFRPTVWQQLVRAFLYTLQFADAYIIMLLAMYYNGYLIICIFIGAFIGRFVFDWESWELGLPGQGHGMEDVTVCCG